MHSIVVGMAKAFQCTSMVWKHKFGQLSSDLAKFLGTGVTASGSSQWGARARARRITRVSEGSRPGKPQFGTTLIWLRPCQFGLVAATRQLLPLGRRLTVIMNCDGIRVRPEWAYT